MTDAAMTRR